MNNPKSLNNIKFPCSLLKRLTTQPLDRHVRRTLQSLHLLVDEDHIIKLCKLAQVNPRFLNRMIYVYSAQ